MRKNYTLENEQSIAWGFDHLSGFFVQQFDENEELLVGADHGDQIVGFSLYMKPLTYEKMVEVLSTHKPALKEFQTFIKKKFELPLTGYHYTSNNGRYTTSVTIESYGDLFRFIDKSSSYGFLLTNIFDVPVEIAHIYDWLQKEIQ